MNLLRKFVEMGETKQEIGRIAFATDPSALPEPSVGLAWHPPPVSTRQMNLLQIPV